MIKAEKAFNLMTAEEWRVEIPGLGPVVRTDEFGLQYTAPVPVPVLGGKPCQIVLDGYEGDEARQEFVDAARNFLAADPAVLRDAAADLHRYYQDVIADWDPGDAKALRITGPGDVWAAVQFGRQAIVSRRSSGDRKVYVSVECECDWEPEHGLQIVFREGRRITKLGPYDGHLTNSDALADPSLENVVYRSV